MIEAVAKLQWSYPHKVSKNILPNLMYCVIHFGVNGKRKSGPRECARGNCVTTRVATQTSLEITNMAAMP